MVDLPLREKYGEFFEKGLQFRAWANESEEPLDPARIPDSLWTLIPLAAFWGIGDDGLRIDLCEEAPQEVWHSFHESFAKHEAAIMDWLAGPEAAVLPPSKEYVAFSAMLDAFHWPR